MSEIKINTYPLHIGDWDGGTSHMSLAQVGAYQRLVNKYYLEGGLEHTFDECLRICGAFTKEERAAVKYVLDSKFTKTPTGYTHAGIDKRIADIRQASAKNQERALKAASGRWSKHATSNATSMREAVLEECHPKTKSHKVEEDDDHRSSSSTVDRRKKKINGVSHTIPTWPGPPEIRASVVAERDEGFALSYLDPCDWDGGSVTISSPTDYAANKLKALECLQKYAILRQEKAA